jgi:HD superfamily phosphodiesterase
MKFEEEKNNRVEFEEKKLIEIAKPYFDSARSGDWEHALRVVRWAKELSNNRNDYYLLVTAAYIHDIGWSGIAPKGKIDLDEMIKLEPKANENSSKLITEVLAKMQFRNSEIEVVNRLVAAADKHESKQDDEAIIVDADSLSKLCIEHLQQKYQPESFEKVIKLFEDELGVRIKTEKGKELFPRLLSELKIKVLGK